MSLIQRIFSDKYVNRPAIANNLLLLAMYRFAYPFAFLLNRFGLSPDQITTLSLLSAFAAFAALILDASVAWFWLFWGLTVLFDFCDGTVARMSSRIATRAFRYDHMSDILKISLVVVGVAIRFEDTHLWALCSIFLFIYLYSEIVSHDLKRALEISKPNAQSTFPEYKPQKPQRIRDRVPVIGFVANRLPFFYNFLLQCFVAISTFNGHTLLVFMALPLGGAITYVTMSYLSTLSLLGCIVGIRQLWRMRR
jgi:hypothetical protein